MTGLLVAELLRARSRRVTWLVPAALVVSSAVVATIGSLQGERWDVGTQLPAVLADVSAYVVWVFAALGAALLGAEHANGGLTRVLSVEPRRVRVGATKLTVAALAGAAGALTTVTGVVAVLAVATAVGPFTADPTGVGGAEAARVVALVSGAAVASALGGAAGLLGRSTAVGIVTVTITLLIVEPVTGALAPDLAGLGPGFSLVAAMGGPDSALVAVTGTNGRWPLAAAWTVVLTTLAVVELSRRDITDAP